MADRAAEGSADVSDEVDGAPLKHPPGLEEARSWVGFKVDEMGGRAAGRVEGALVDAADGEPTWLVIRVGRLRRYSAVPFELAAAGIGHVWVPYSRETMRGAPEIDPAAGLERADEQALCEHYGIPPGTGRRAVIEDRDAEGPTSVPAPADR